MEKTLIAYDSLNQISQYMHYDDMTDTAHFESVGDATPVLEFNKMLQNDEDVTKKGIKGGFWRYASIPAIFQLKLMQEKGLNIWKREHAAAISKVLEDPDYRFLKCTTKKHIIKAHD